MNEKEIAVVEAMLTYGGSFVHALADCFFRADRNNFIKLKNAFHEYWSQYEKMAKKNNDTR